MNQEQAELQIESLVKLIEGKIEYITSYHSSGTSAKKIIITYDENDYERKTEKSSKV